MSIIGRGFVFATEGADYEFYCDTCYRRESDHNLSRDTSKCSVRRWGPGRARTGGESVATDLLVQLKELGLLDEFRAAVRLPCPWQRVDKMRGRRRVAHNDYNLNPTRSGVAS